MPSWVQVFSLLHPLIWTAWGIYWFISSRGVKTIAREESGVQKLAHFGPIVIAVLLLVFPDTVPLLREQVMPPGAALFCVGTLVLAGGLLFTVWARVVLGTNWSSTVALKRSHELVQAGPYAWVRHPIYTGILAGFLGSALAEDQWGGYVGVALVFLGFWFKLLREEKLMRQTFGESYVRYCAQTKRLVPFLF